MAKIQIGSVSTGTLRNEDLIPAFADELSVMEASEAGVKLLDEVWKFLGKEEPYKHPDGPLADFESEDAGYLVDELHDALNEHAPPHMRFGSHEGDGADFGWWPVDFYGCQRTNIGLVRPSSLEGRFVDLDCNLLVEVNDHGNMTVRELGGEVIWDSV
jgi:hypothetical protein